jgi:hypothetical protein
MISRNADTQAYQYLLSSLRQSVIAHAGRLVSGEVKPRYVDPNDVDALLRHATGIVNEEDFAPLFTMIDGDDAEREGIEQTWPGLPIRACQFHVMRAIRKRARDMFGTNPQGELRSGQLLAAFRRFQRCPTVDSYQRYLDDLEISVTQIAGDRGEAWIRFKTYLDRSWLNRFWRPCVMDYGIPPQYTRDGPLSTNNYEEASFRTFDRVFLSSRVNKRWVQSVFSNNQHADVRPGWTDFC